MRFKAYPKLQNTLTNSLSLICKVCLLFLIIIQAFHLKFIPITGGIDPSWQYIVNYSFFHHIKFVFTAGLFGFITTPMNIGSNLDIAVTFRFLVWVCFSGLFLYLALKKSFSLLNLAIFGLTFSLSGSVLSFDYFLCFLLLIFLSLSFSANRRSFVVLYSLITALAALLWLIKFTAAVLVASSCILCIGILFFRDTWKALRAFIMTFAGIPILFSGFYMIYRPSFSEMLSYLRSAYEISSGYNIAMSITGERSVLFFALGSIITYVLLVVLLYKNHETPSLFISLMCIPSVFVAFKHGFVRQDGHETVFWAFMTLIVGLIFLFTNFRHCTKWILVLLIPMIAPLVFLPGYAIPIANILGVHRFEAMIDLVNYTQTKKDLNTLPPELLNIYTLPRDWVSAIGEHTVSIFPWETSYAYVNNLNYMPFPVIQAYSAYTPYLDEMNADLLENPETAPEFIFMQLLALDGRHPLIDVPAMWLAMYKWYEVEKQVDKPYPLFLLKRRTDPRFQEIELIEKKEYPIDDSVIIPVEEQPVVMKMSLQLSFLGKLVKNFFKVPEIKMNLSTHIGYGTYRVIPDTLENGLFINYLPLRLQDVYALMNQNQVSTQIDHFNISGEGLPLYQDSMLVEFYRIPTIHIRKL